MERENGSDEMILVPRAELLAWAKAWLYENDPGDGTDCVTPFDTYLLKPPVKAHCTTCSCVPGMTPAVRFDTTLAEREGAVRDHLVRMGWTPPAEAQAQGGGECCHSWEDYGQMNVVRCNKCEARAVNGYEDRPFTAPPSAATPLSREHGSLQEMYNPSAPEGVECAPIRYFAYDSDCGDYNEFDTLPEAIADAQEALDYAGDDGWPEGGPSIYYGAVLGEAREVEGSRRPAGPNDHPDADFIVEYELTGSDALAQQPEAAGEMAELVGLLDEVRSHFTRDDDLPDDLLPRIDAALATQQGGSDNG